MMQKMLDYMMIGVRPDTTWDCWFPSSYTKDAPGQSAIPWVTGMTIPDLPAFSHDPFVRKYDQEKMNDRTTWLLQQSFVAVSEEALVAEGFSPTSAKFLTYLRMSLIKAGGFCHNEQWGDLQIRISGPHHPIRLDCKPLDLDALTIAEAAWPMIAMTCFGIFIDTGYKFTSEAAAACAALWVRTPWPKMLEEYDLNWKQIFQYLIRCFSPRAILVALTFRLVLGTIPNAPIYDVVAYTVSDNCAVTMISPWGPVAAMAWWRIFERTVTQLLLTSRMTLRAATEDLGVEAFGPVIAEWIPAELNPLLDIVRIMAPIVKDTLRPMYMPSISSHLYIEYTHDDLRLTHHAENFARTVVTHAFGHERLNSLPFSIKDVAIAISRDTMLHGITPVGQASQAIAEVGPSVTFASGPWAFPAARKQPTWDTETVTSYGDSDQTATLSTTSLGSVPPGLTEEEMRSRAITHAKGALFSEKYGDKEFEDAMSAALNSKTHNRFFRPELRRAKKMFEKKLTLLRQLTADGCAVHEVDEI